MARRTVILFLGAAVAIAGLAGLGWLTLVQQRSLSLLREENQMLQSRQSELNSLQAEQKQAPGPAAEIERLREDTKDLLRLRNEVRQLREQLQELDALRAANAQLLQAVQGAANMPSNQQALVVDARKRGAILGIHVGSVPNAPGSSATPGALVIGFEPSSPVAESGLKPGDIIIRLDGRPIDTGGQLQAEMLTRKPGETVVLDVVRSGAVLRFQVKTRAWPE